MEAPKKGFQCCGFTKESGHSHGTLPNDPQRHPPHHPYINIGIYIAEDVTMVGTTTSDNNNNQIEPEVILEIPSEITFRDDGIVLGGESERNRQEENYFRVFDLIKETELNPFSVVRLNGMVLTLTKEEILSIFFETLLMRIKSLKAISSVDHIVVTIPFTVTSLEREKIKMAATTAGYPEVRILSSLITTGITYAAEMNYYYSALKLIKESLVIFVGQYGRTSFSMALLEIGPGYIYTKKVISSDQMRECQDPIFQENHSAMFENKVIKSERTYQVFKIYKAAIDALCPKERRLAIEPILIKREERPSTLDQNFSSVFNKDIQCVLIPSGPLTGACYLASKFLPESRIPGNLVVCDASLGNLICSSSSGVNFNDGRSLHNKYLEERVPNFCPGIVFETQIPLLPDKDNRIALSEQLLPDILKVATQYSVTLSRGEYASRVVARLLGRVDQNGIFALGIVFPPGVGGNVCRVTGPCISEYDYAGYKVVRSYYQALAYVGRNSKS